MKVVVSCVRERETVVFDNPTDLWAWLRLHTNRRDPVEIHDTHCETDTGMRLW